jgi:hypothetical protein
MLSIRDVPDLGDKIQGNSKIKEFSSYTKQLVDFAYILKSELKFHGIETAIFEEEIEDIAIDDEGNLVLVELFFYNLRTEVTTYMYADFLEDMEFEAAVKHVLWSTSKSKRRRRRRKII